MLERRPERSSCSTVQALYVLDVHEENILRLMSLIVPISLTSGHHSQRAVFVRLHPFTSCFPSKCGTSICATLIRTIDGTDHAHLRRESVVSLSWKLYWKSTAIASNGSFDAVDEQVPRRVPGLPYMLTEAFCGTKSRKLRIFFDTDPSRGYHKAPQAPYNDDTANLGHRKATIIRSKSSDCRCATGPVLRPRRLAGYSM